MLVPAPGRSVVKMAPIKVGTGVMGINGQEIVKDDYTVAHEELLNTRGTIVKVGPPRPEEEIWFAAGDDALISRLGGTKFELRDEENVHTFWLLPNECILGVFRDE